MITRKARALLPAIALVAAPLVVASAHADPIACQRAIVRGSAGLSRKVLTALTRCREAVRAGTSAGPCPEAKTTRALTRAELKLSRALDKRCGGPDYACGIGDDESLAAIGWNFGFCPDFQGAGCTDAIADCGDVARCVACVGEHAADQMLALAYDDLVTPALDSNLRQCQAAITKSAVKLFVSATKSLQQCDNRVLKGVATGPCPDDRTRAQVLAARARLSSTICKACAGPSQQCGDPDDLVPTAIGFTSSCPAVTVPDGASCGAPITNLSDLSACVACVAQANVGCLEAITVPGLKSYPPECNPVLPTPTASAVDPATPNATPTVPLATATPTTTTVPILTASPTTTITGPTLTATPTASATPAPILLDIASAGSMAGPLTTMSAPVAVGEQPNRLLVVGVAAQDGSSTDCAVSGVTYSGHALTQVDGVQVTNGTPAKTLCVSLWYLVAPPVGTTSLDVTFAGPVDETSGGAIVLTNVRQGPPEASAVATAGGSTVATGITTLTDGAWLVDVVGGGLRQDVVPESSQTERYDTSQMIPQPPSSAGAGSTRLIATAWQQIVQWRQTGATRMGLVVAAIAPAPPTGPTATMTPPPAVTATPTATITAPVPTSTSTPSPLDTGTTSPTPTETSTITPISAETPTETATPSQTETPTPSPTDTP